MTRLWLHAAALLAATTCAAWAGDPPRRIVSLAPNLTQMVIEAGAGDQLIAVTPFCEAPETIARLPGGIQPEAEQVLGLAPDLVLATSMTPLATRQQLTRLGLRVEVIDTPSLQVIREAMSKVATLLGGQPTVHTRRAGGNSATIRRPALRCRQRLQRGLRHPRARNPGRRRTAQHRGRRRRSVAATRRGISPRRRSRRPHRGRLRAGGPRKRAADFARSSGAAAYERHPLRPRGGFPRSRLQCARTGRLASQRSFARGGGKAVKT